MIGGQLHREIKEVDRLLSELRAFVVWSEVRPGKMRNGFWSKLYEMMLAG